MSHSHVPSASFDGSSMDHMGNYNESSLWANESQFDNATIFQDHNANALDFNLQQLGHDDCRPCDSPDCGEEPCPVSDQAYECYGTDCFEGQNTNMCHADSHGQCAGNAPPEILDAAYHLYGLGGAATDNPIIHCDPNAHVHATNMQNFSMNNNYSTNNYQFGQQQEPFAINDFGAEFCNPQFCTFDPAQGFGDVFFGCGHFPEVGENLNDLHAFHHHVQAFPDKMCPTRMEPSPMTHSDTNTPSEISPGRPRSTPITASSASSPRQCYASLAQRTDSSTNPLHQEEEDDDDYICMWLMDGNPCNKEFNSAEELQNHTCKEHISHLTKAHPGFYCQWAGCARLEVAEPTPFAQKSKLERHMQKHTGYKSEVCTVCGRHYATAQTLAQHMKIHAPEKLSVCEWPGCNYRTAQPSQLTMHKRTMHLNTKPLKCEICNAQFAESSNLSKHRKTHKEPGEYYCGICNKKFARDDQVRRHWKKHVKDEVTELERAKEKLIAKGISEAEVEAMSISDLLHRESYGRRAVVLTTARTSPSASSTISKSHTQINNSNHHHHKTTTNGHKRAKSEGSPLLNPKMTMNDVPAFRLETSSSSGNGALEGELRRQRDFMAAVSVQPTRNEDGSSSSLWGNMLLQQSFSGVPISTGGSGVAFGSS